MKAIYKGKSIKGASKLCKASVYALPDVLLYCNACMMEISNFRTTFGNPG